MRNKHLCLQIKVTDKIDYFNPLIPKHVIWLIAKFFQPNFILFM